MESPIYVKLSEGNPPASDVDRLRCEVGSIVK